jgi:nitroreductase
LFDPALNSAALPGIGACLMEGFVPAEFDQVLALPAQGLASVVCCALGYRHDDDKCAVAPKVRFPKSEFVKQL